MHYTHPEFQKKVKDLGFHQSMSRRGNCWDNASMESFFGHMKDGIDFKACSSLAEVQQAIDEYMEYYNNHRYQWSLRKMTPAQYEATEKLLIKLHKGKITPDGNNEELPSGVIHEIKRDTSPEAS